MGKVGPTYDNMAECFIYNFMCYDNNNHLLDCIINKTDPEDVPYEGE